MSDLLDRPLAFVDLETTGATATADRITEIGIVTLDGGVTWEWSQLINPEQPIPPFIQNLTGISDAMVADAPTFAERAREVLERLEGHIFIAHNARFDYGFLKNEFKRVGIDFRAPVICTVKLSRRLYPEFHKHNLDSLIARHNLDMPEAQRHRALGDARAICQFWQQAQAAFPAEEFDAALRALSSHAALPPHLDPAVIDELPDGPGVYLFYGENDLPLYVGKSKRIRQRVLAHFAADHAKAKEMSLSQQTRRVDWIDCPGEIGALLTEARLVKELQPTHNRQLRRSKDFCAWQLVDQGDGHWLPRLVMARDLDPGRQEHLYGVFKNPKEAKAALTDLAKTRKLCPVVLGLEVGEPGKPCFARQLKHCKGACVGEESLRQHSLRLMDGLAKLRLETWPFPGPAVLREGDAVHVVDHWRYLGSAHSDEEIAALLADGRGQFDRDTYRILVKVADQMTPLPTAPQGA